MKDITICINTCKKELKYIQLLLKSLKQNMANENNEILVFIDTDTPENLIESSLKEYKNVFKNFTLLKNTMPIKIGYQHNVNLMFELAKNDIVCLIQSDMVVAKDFDINLVKNLKDEKTLVCGTRIEPPLHGPSPHTITNNFGLTPDEFQWDAFNSFAESVKNPTKITEYYFAPFALYKKEWVSIGGHDAQFRRSREDSDILARLVLNDVKCTQSWDALCYHFTCTTSRGQDWFNKNNLEAQMRVQKQNIADQIELLRFIRKWGSFSHEHAKKLKYFNVEAFVDSQDVAFLAKLEPFFHKLYIPNKDIVQQMVNYLNESAYKTANELDEYSVNDWEKYKYLFNVEDYGKRIVYASKPEDVKDYAILVVMPHDLERNELNTFIPNMADIINNEVEDYCEYSFGSFTIKINNKKDFAPSKIVVNNPKYDLFKKVI
jgi:hypothetical protein